jgi:hypothetical protein
MMAPYLNIHALPIMEQPLYVPGESPPRPTMEFLQPTMAMYEVRIAPAMTHCPKCIRDMSKLRPGTPFACYEGCPAGREL